MSVQLNKLTAVGAKAQAVLANNQIAYTFTYATSAATNSATIAPVSLVGDIGGVGRSNASTLAATLTTNFQTSSGPGNAGGFSIGLRTGVFGTATPAQAFVTIKGGATQMVAQNTGGWAGNPSGLAVNWVTLAVSNPGAGWAFPQAEVYSCTVIFQGSAAGTGIPY